ncbi:hypothetical protein Glove_122g107 [Diversispora epigaea]|uniref:BTB domain-containing protein n=1 Tax=Diversispora epigaea TaxID=1348612 RepID=A0A397J3F9_9GLOM|nr:hypothetical protein Glove_122g107 [Diversispora epigaea]
MSFKFLEKLSQDFTELLDDNEEYNVIIETNKKSFTAHSPVLRYRSSYFKKELTNTIANENNIKIITKPNISSELFEIILKYIYLGIINVENVDTKTIYELMIIAGELEFDELSKKLESHFIETKSPWLRIHFAFVYHSIFKINKFKDLENFCNNIIAKYPNLIFESNDFTSLQESALISILKRNDLQIEESGVWDYVIKWGIAQNPDLPEILDKWSKENFLTLKTTLQHCLPHIRYFQISNENVMNKIKPYKKILDKKLWDDLIQYLLVPNQPIKSTILPARKLTQETLLSRVLITVEALWDYCAGEGENEADLSFKKGDIVEVVEKVNEDWWSGRVQGKNAVGIFPKVYTKEIGLVVDRNIPTQAFTHQPPPFQQSIKKPSQNFFQPPILNQDNWKSTTNASKTVTENVSKLTIGNPRQMLQKPLRPMSQKLKIRNPQQMPQKPSRQKSQNFQMPILELFQQDN